MTQPSRAVPVTFGAPASRSMSRLLPARYDYNLSRVIVVERHGIAMEPRAPMNSTSAPNTAAFMPLQEVSSQPGKRALSDVLQLARCVSSSS